jgi:hypothetical protein
MQNWQVRCSITIAGVCHPGVSLEQRSSGVIENNNNANDDDDADNNHKKHNDDNQQYFHFFMTIVVRMVAHACSQGLSVPGIQSSVLLPFFL